MSLWKLPLPVQMPEIRTPLPGPVLRPGRYGLSVTGVPANETGVEQVRRCSCCGASSTDDVRGVKGWRQLRRGVAVCADFCASCPKGNVYRL